MNITTTFILFHHHHHHRRRRRSSPLHWYHKIVLYICTCNGKWNEKELRSVRFVVGMCAHVGILCTVAGMYNNNQINIYIYGSMWGDVYIYPTHLKYRASLEHERDADIQCPKWYRIYVVNYLWRFVFGKMFSFVKWNSARLPTPHWLWPFQYSNWISPFIQCDNNFFFDTTIHSLSLVQLYWGNRNFHDTLVEPFFIAFGSV